MSQTIPAVLIKKMPRDLWGKVRVIAARRTTTIREVVIDALRRYADAEKGEK